MNEEEPKLAKFKLGSSYDTPWLEGQLWELLVVFDLYSLEDSEVPTRRRIVDMIENT